MHVIITDLVTHLAMNILCHDHNFKPGVVKTSRVLSQNLPKLNDRNY